MNGGSKHSTHVQMSPSGAGETPDSHLKIKCSAHARSGCQRRTLHLGLPSSSSSPALPSRRAACLRRTSHPPLLPREAILPALLQLEISVRSTCAQGHMNTSIQGPCRRPAASTGWTSGSPITLLHRASVVIPTFPHHVLWFLALLWLALVSVKLNLRPGPCCGSDCP